MSTNPIPPVPPTGRRGPRQPGPRHQDPDIGTRPDDDSPLTEPVPDNPDTPDENPDDQLPRW